MQQPATLTAAETIAEQVDAVTFKPMNQGSGFQPSPNFQSPGGTIPMELDAISKLTPNE